MWIRDTDVECSRRGEKNKHMIMDSLQLREVLNMYEKCMKP